MHLSQYNMSRVRVIGGLTPSRTSNKSTQSIQSNRSSQSSLRSRTVHTTQFRINPSLDIIGSLYSLESIVRQVSLVVVIMLTSLIIQPSQYNLSRVRDRGPYPVG